MSLYSASSDSASCREFLLAPYDTYGNGRLRPSKPTEGPCVAQTGQCQIVVNHWRTRKTGSQAELLVIECRTHRQSFTVYPPELAPYLRAPMLPRQLESPVEGEAGAATGDELAEARAFEGTCFGPALEAADNERWKSVDAGKAIPWRSSRVRQLDRIVGWLGVEAGLSDGERVERAELLGVEALTLSQAAGLAASGEPRARGEAACQVLAAVGLRGCAAERLAHAGQASGLWGTPWRWDARAGRLRRLSFRTVPSHEPSASEPRVESPTTLPVAEDAKM